MGLDRAMEYLPVFIAVTAGAVVLQALVMVAMYVAMRKTTSRMESLTTQVTTKVLPTAELAHSMLTELKPRIETTINNVTETSALVRNQLQRLDATVTDAIDRARLQIIRADEVVGRTLDKVEETTEIVQETVVSPVRQLSGLVHGLAAGISVFVGRRNSRHGHHVSVPQDEMFI